MAEIKLFLSVAPQSGILQYALTSLLDGSSMTSRNQASIPMSVSRRVIDSLSRLEFLAFCTLLIAVAYTCITLAPDSLLLHPGIPPYFSMISCVIFTVFFVALRLMPLRNVQFERLSLALFLAYMPIIYIWSALLNGETTEVLAEIAGAFIFMGMAWWGFKRSSSPWILALGIAAHGVAWDSWHHNHSAYIDYWYPLGCLLIDIALAFVVVTQFKAHREGQRHKAPQTT